MDRKITISNFMYLRPFLVLEYLDFIFQNLLLALSLSVGYNLNEGFPFINVFNSSENTHYIW